MISLKTLTNHVNDYLAFCGMFRLFLAVRQCFLCLSSGYWRNQQAVTNVKERENSGCFGIIHDLVGKISTFFCLYVFLGAEFALNLTLCKWFSYSVKPIVLQLLSLTIGC